jgi:hypothetical protein
MAVQCCEAARAGDECGSPGTSDHATPACPCGGPFAASDVAVLTDYFRRAREVGRLGLNPIDIGWAGMPLPEAP